MAFAEDQGLVPNTQGIWLTVDFNSNSRGIFLPPLASRDTVHTHLHTDTQAYMLLKLNFYYIAFK